jgi:DNA-directed RNA polymerase subunit RPC12/RpoP
MAEGGLAETGKCPQCGGYLTFDPASAGLRCGHCGGATPIPATTAVVERLPYERWAGADAESSGGTVEQLSFECDGCGATTVLPPGNTSGACPYCKRAFVAAARSARTLRPGAVLPLAIPRDDAGRRMQAWLGSRWFAPRDLTTLARAEGFTPVYVPAWSFTADASTDYEGERGDDRTEWRTVTSTNSEGQSESHQESYTVTDWDDARGAVDQHFDDVVVPASATITDHEEDALQPFDLPNALAYQPEYVLGCVSESYSVTLPAGWTKAQESLDDDIVRAVEEDIGGDHQRIHRRSTAWSSIVFLHLLLPVWVAAYVYRGTTYRVLVNGRTGQVIGRRPYSKAKIALAVLVAIVVIVGIVLLYRSQQ